MENEEEEGEGPDSQGHRGNQPRGLAYAGTIDSQLGSLSPPKATDQRDVGQRKGLGWLWATNPLAGSKVALMLVINSS